MALTLVPTYFLVRDIPIEADFKNLLPQDKVSVVELNRIIEKVGGVGNLSIVVTSPDREKTIAYIDAIAPELQALPKEYVRSVDYNVSTTQKFFETNKYLYAEREDIQEIRRRLKEKIDFEKLKSNPFYFSLEEEEVTFDISDIREKYRNKNSTGTYSHFSDGYFFTPSGDAAIIRIQPAGDSTGVGFAKDLIQVVQQKMDQYDPTSFHPQMEVGLAGDFHETVEQYYRIVNDMVSTLALCFALVGLVVWGYFRSLRVVFLLAVPILIGVGWTFALTRLAIGYLNSQTAFLGSIIVGNGVNTGIIFIARYFEELKRGLSINQAVNMAIGQVWKPTFYASVTTAAAFTALLFSQIKGLSHFGFIGSAGMLLTWFATLLFLPRLITVTEGKKIQFSSFKLISRWGTPIDIFHFLIRRFSKPILVFASLFVVAGGIKMTLFIPDALEYDFRKLSNQSLKENEKTHMYWQSYVDQAFKEHSSPSVLLLESTGQAAVVCDAIMADEKDLPKSERNIDKCNTIYNFIPTQQNEKLKELNAIYAMIKDPTVNFSKAAYGPDYDDLNNIPNLKIIEMDDLPPQIQKTYREKDGTLGRVAYVYPGPKANLQNGKMLIAFVNKLSSIRLPDDTEIKISGKSFIFADLLKALKEDGLKVIIISFLLVMTLIGINFRNGFAIAYVAGGLLLSVFSLLALQSFFGIKINFFNFIAIPVTFGIGVDYCVNIIERYRSEKISILDTVRYSGSAILLCSTTTIIGYTTLLGSLNQALVSFGWLALIGEFSCLFAGLLVMPSVVYFLVESKKKASRPVAHRKVA